MRLDTHHSGGKVANLAKRLPSILRSRGAILLCFAAFIFIVGAATQRYGFIDQGVRTARSLKEVPDLVRVMSAQPEAITIDIKHKHMIQLDQKRKQALAADVLVSSDDDFVPATITYRGERTPVKLRLKGDLKDHWNTDKWSFRIVAKGDRALFGMKQFSIQRPDARNYLYEWFFHRALAREDVLSLRYSFIDVTINGENRGIYALEEHFEKRLLEYNERREGPIIRFNEDLFFLEARDHGYLSGISGPSTLSGEGSYLASSIDGFQSNRWLSDETKRPLYIEAIHLLEAFRRSELSASEVFDVPRLAKFLALSDMLRAQHSARWRNIRFYYNPVSSRLEPIGFDGTQKWLNFRGILPMMNWNYKSGLFYDLYMYNELFDDTELYRAYLSALDEVSAPGYLEALVADLGDEIKTNELIIRRDYPRFRFSDEPSKEARRYIRSLLTPHRAVHAHIVSERDGTVDLKIGNLHFLPIEIVGLSFADNVETLTEPVLLKGRNPDALVDYRTFSLPNPTPAEAPPKQPLAADTSEEDNEPPALTMLYRVMGTERILESAVFDYPLQNREIASRLMRQPANIEKFDFIEIDKASRRVYVQAGSWTVSENLIVPAGYRLTAGPGTTIELTDAATILTRSPVEFRGNADYPIVFRSTDRDGGGLFVLEAGERSVLEHVVFDGLSSPQDPGVTVTGAVTFYRSPVSVLESHFLNANAEDALNIINARFEISGSVFQGSASDALDVDFGEGEIVASRFIAPANDAIDVSGSAIKVINTSIREAGDKAISAGESSRLSGRDINIEGSNVGVASKDLSEVRLDNVTITSTNIGLAAYQKKPEFGPAVIELNQLSMSEVGEPDWIEERSRLSIDGTHTMGTRTNPREIFYPDEV